MGVPKFYRWLSERYPRMNQPISRFPNKGDEEETGEEEIKLDKAYIHTKMNEFTRSPDISHLYIDLNGILHGCAHNNANQSLSLNDEEDESDKAVNGTTSVKTATTNEEIIQNVEVYLDRIIDIAEPTEVIYIAVDGVAPRAKLNQQRSRRFKTGAEKSLSRQYELNRNSAGTLSGYITATLDMDRVNDANENDFLQDPDNSEFYESNAITPGTKFMADLTTHMEKIIRSKIINKIWTRRNNDVKIIFSGADVPGEGEHKIMNYIRCLDMKSANLENGKHCIVGQDGDLIMLALMTKLRNICLLREHVQFLTMKQLKKQPFISTESAIKSYIENHRFEYLHIAILRDYIALEFDCVPDTSNGKQTKKYDLNRTIDDILFLFMLVGNDFLPNIPSIDIGDGGLDTLLEEYKGFRIDHPSDPYLTINGKISDFGRLHSYFTRVQGLLYKSKSNWRGHLLGDNDERDGDYEFDEVDSYEDPGLVGRFKQLFMDSIFHFKKESEDKSSPLSLPSNRKKLKQVPIDYLEKVYYTTKFASKPEPSEVCESYFQTLQWVFDYYYRGTSDAGWSHYYNYHYAPMLHNITEYTSNVASGTVQLKAVEKTGGPLPPAVQLLCCLPPSSARLVPPKLRHIMLDDNLGIFPTKFKIDLNGKRNSWESTILLPFIEEDTKQFLLTQAENIMNNELQKEGMAYVYSQSGRSTYEEDKSDSFVGDKKYKSSESHIYPTLVAPKIEPPTYSLSKVGVNTFGTRSRYPTLALYAPAGLINDMPPVSSLAKQLVGKTITFNYPYLQEGFVTGMRDAEKYIRGDRVNEVKDGHALWLKKLQKDLYRGSGTVGSGGIHTYNEDDIILFIRPFEGLRDKGEKNVVKTYAEFEIQVPLTYCLLGLGAKLLSELDAHEIDPGEDPYLFENENARILETEAMKLAMSAAIQTQKKSGRMRRSRLGFHNSNTSALAKPRQKTRSRSKNVRRARRKETSSLQRKSKQIRSFSSSALNSFERQHLRRTCAHNKSTLAIATIASFGFSLMYRTNCKH